LERQDLRKGFLAGMAEIFVLRHGAPLLVDVMHFSPRPLRVQPFGGKKKTAVLRNFLRSDPLHERELFIVVAAGDLPAAERGDEEAAHHRRLPAKNALLTSASSGGAGASSLRPVMILPRRLVERPVVKTGVGRECAISIAEHKSVWKYNVELIISVCIHTSDDERI
jgi:hypothetical protein